MKVGSTAELNMAQADVDNAFYRISLPDGMCDHFALPAVRRSELVAALGPDVVVPDGGANISVAD
eukprot:5409205-Pyramimonas_sp.AAC.1